MTAIYYTAKRKLSAGHTLGVVYSFDIGMRALNEQQNVNRKEHRSLSGDVETWLKNIEELVSFQTVNVLETDPICNVIKEFLSSVAGGETFSMDLWGTTVTPSDVKFYAMSSKGSKPSRAGASRNLSFNFTVREIV